MEYRATGWAMKIVFICAFSALVTGMLWVITREPWVSVFACGAGLGLYLLENHCLSVESRDHGLHVAELEKQVVSLRTTIDTLVVMNREMDNELTRLKPKQAMFLQPRRSLSASEL